MPKLLQKIHPDVADRHSRTHTHTVTHTFVSLPAQYQPRHGSQHAFSADRYASADLPRAPPEDTRSTPPGRPMGEVAAESEAPPPLAGGGQAPSMCCTNSSRTVSGLHAGERGRECRRALGN